MPADCPNCGANIRDEGLADLVRCPFCSTVLERRGPSRRELETEREQILGREAEWERRIREASERRVEDYVIPPIGCCGIYFGLFVIGSLILAAVGLKGSKDASLFVAMVAIGGGLLGAAWMIWRRIAGRRERIAMLERERSAERGLREERLRRIEAELESLGGR